MSESTPTSGPGAGNLSFIPHMNSLGASLVEMHPGTALISLPYSEHLIGDPNSGVLHGGVLTALLDNAAGTAVHTLMEKRVSIATLDLRIDYMKPATVGEDIQARATCYKMTTNVAFVRGTAFHQSEDNPIATMAATFMLSSNQTRKGAE